MVGLNAGILRRIGSAIINHLKLKIIKIFKCLSLPKSSNVRWKSFFCINELVDLLANNKDEFMCRIDLKLLIKRDAILYQSIFWIKNTIFYIIV